MADFNADAVSALFAALVSKAKGIGAFRMVMTHEPKAAPATLPALAVWWMSIGPYPPGSGLAAVSGGVTFAARVYEAKMLEKPEDNIDKRLLAHTAQLMNVLSGAFTLTGNARNIDLLGAAGQPLTAASMCPASTSAGSAARRSSATTWCTPPGSRVSAGGTIRPGSRATTPSGSSGRNSTRARCRWLRKSCDRFWRECNERRSDNADRCRPGKGGGD